MTDTANLGLPFIDGSQAQKHITHNEALRILDAAIQIAVLDLTRTTAPSSPADGERHVVAAAATGAWAGQATAIATFQDGAWAFLAPKTGWCIWSVADSVVYVFDGTIWRDLRSLPVSLDNTAHVGNQHNRKQPEPAQRQIQRGAVRRHRCRRRRDRRCSRPVVEGNLNQHRIDLLLRQLFRPRRVRSGGGRYLQAQGLARRIGVGRGFQHRPEFGKPLAAARPCADRHHRAAADHRQSERLQSHRHC